MIKRRRLRLKRLLRNESGIAAVEFGLILPLMLVIYMGLVELSRGMRTAQRLDLVAHTLADLTAQKLDCPNPAAGTSATKCAKGQAGLSEADISSIFSAANTLMGLPATSTALKMAISEINITSPSANTWQAKTSWTVTRNGATARRCDPALVPSNAAPVSATTIPSSYVQQAANGVNPTVGPIIVADVIYNYSPGVHFELFKWNSPPTWSMQRTSYAPVRNTYVPSHIQYYMTSGTNCNSTP
ncbi:TadE/TadG family type IV pilus assembly protein [Methylocystis parvus]|uniref:TadE/TadG family type IV pilus assembly protein n=1 Tax=Methylocystis parvus TaxID=134 RepID=UPI000314F3B5|nr:TadE/TadG family type IV pilus assembly protein [Methylocystis parvus]WBK01151.1 pilus assembly protein [Methylocystis parvus OBBP]